MRQILWFRRDLRIEDNAILANAKDEVLSIFIFDKNILNTLEKDDKRITFIFNSVLKLKKQLKTLGLDLVIYYDYPKKVFEDLKEIGFDEVLCSIDFDEYSKNRDKEIEKIIPMRRFIDSFILNPKYHLKNDGTPYKVFTPFYNSLSYLVNSTNIEEYKINKNLKKIEFDYSLDISLEKIGFEKQKLPEFLYKTPKRLLEDFLIKIEDYEKNRDFFSLEATSKLSVHLRFGLISPKQIFNFIKQKTKEQFFIRELFWREFYNYILYYFPKSQFENFNGLKISWNENEEDFKKWCEGKTGVPIIDAAMQHLNKTGVMHNRLRMITASFLTKNLFIDWKKGEKYFALKLLDFEASSNIGSWQWSASTGADSAPYFRVFNPYIQSLKFDKDAKFIKSIFPHLAHIDSKQFHKENTLTSNPFIDYPSSMVDISFSRKEAIRKFKEAKNEFL